QGVGIRGQESEVRDQKPSKNEKRKGPRKRDPPKADKSTLRFDNQGSPSINITQFPDQISPNSHTVLDGKDAQLAKTNHKPPLSSPALARELCR
ncbi:MAG: hypothetical protein OEM90_15055, partial [Desulfobacteraceae bacterium]|nr:hypothetical protein [Desulfobacteraceae bacterium]